MQKILIANPNAEQRIKLCKNLANDKRLEIIETVDGITTLEKYIDIRPNVLVLDSCLKDINCIEIIDRLSTSIADKRNNNIIEAAEKVAQKIVNWKIIFLIHYFFIYLKIVI